MVCRAKIPLIKSVSFKKAVEISRTQEICTEFTHMQYIIWVNSVQISWVLKISMAFLKETDFSTLSSDISKNTYHVKIKQKSVYTHGNRTLTMPDIHYSVLHKTS